MQNSVHFFDNVEYSNLEEVLNKASVFIGSGTAILEAASLGVPCIVGIESSVRPITYGYLSDIEGFSYNEIMPNVATKEIKNYITQIKEMSNDEWSNLSIKMFNKSKQFSIDLTAQGFMSFEKKAKSIHFEYDNKFLFFLSFLFYAILDILHLNRIFRNRREQSSRQ